MIRTTGAPWLVILALAAPGCGNDFHHTHPEAGMDAPADGPAGPPWWHPKPDETKNWDVQIAAPYDLATPRRMYILNLWDVVPAATMIDYGDGDPVSVPAGSQATAIADLHARVAPKLDPMEPDKPPVVICYVTTGTIHMDDVDARKFPGYEANPPQDPTPPKSGSVIGWATDAGPDERFLDIKEADRSAWTKLIYKRLDLAKQIGCDGIDPAGNERDLDNPSTSGFTIELSDMNGWYKEVAAQAHDPRELSVGMHGAYTVAGQPDDLRSVFDWLLVERCGEFMDCDFTKPFLSAFKPVFAIDYQTDIDGGIQDPNAVCLAQQHGNVNEGLVKDTALSSTFRQQCVP